MACVHTYVETASNLYLKCSKCNVVCKASTLEVLKSKSVARLSWSESERRMLNNLRKPSYADYAKAETDLKNYWQ